MTESRSRLALLGFTVVLAALEIADGFRLELPWMAWAYAVVLLGGAAWLWRTGAFAAVALLGALHLLELLMVVFVFRTAEQAPPTALWWAFLLLSLGGTAAAAWCLVSQRRVAHG